MTTDVHILDAPHSGVNHTYGKVEYRFNIARLSKSWKITIWKRDTSPTSGDRFWTTVAEAKSTSLRHAVKRAMEGFEGEVQDELLKSLN